jgi:tetratricopeptide (TPR) repeat protein
VTAPGGGPTAAAHLQAGLAATEAGDQGAALAAFMAAWRAAPGDPGVALLVANSHRLLGDTPAARATLQQAVARGGWETPAAAHQLGTALLEVGAPHEAARCFEWVRRQRPRDPAPLGALAAALRARGEPAAAWPLVQRALALAPDTPAFLFTAAQVRHALGDLDGALAWLERCEAIRPGHAPTRMQRAHTLLLRGASAEAWQAFEARPLPVPDTGARPWLGEPLAGASVLVMAEQGAGDQFQFARFLPALRARGAGRVLVECHADAVSLFRASGHEAVPRGAPPRTDWHVPLLSLPHRLQLGAAAGGEPVPYLHPPTPVPPAPFPPRHPGRWRLGVVWAGNPAFVEGTTRDLPPGLLPQLAAIPRVDWVVLQHGAAREDAPAEWARPPLPRDWGETTQWLQQLDGLVTTDTGIANLAGALGCRAWVLLQHVPDWRWGLTAPRTPWYPTLQLLRQPRPGAWDSVVQALAETLADALAAPPGR